MAPEDDVTRNSSRSLPISRNPSGRVSRAKQNLPARRNAKTSRLHQRANDRDADREFCFRHSAGWADAEGTSGPSGRAAAVKAEFRTDLYRQAYSSIGRTGESMGRGKYTADVHLPGMLYARMVDASVPHGRITAIDTSAAERLPGVKSVHVIEHTFGIAELRDPSKKHLRSIRSFATPGSRLLASPPFLRRLRGCRGVDRSHLRCYAVCRGGQEARAEDAPKVFPGPPTRRELLVVAVVRKTFPRLAMCMARNRRRSAMSRRVLPMPTRCRKRILHPGADPLGTRDAWLRCRLEAGRSHGLRLNARYRERAR